MNFDGNLLVINNILISKNIIIKYLLIEIN